MNASMKQQRKILQTPLLIRNGEEVDIYMVITEVSRETGSALLSYTCRIPEWSLLNCEHKEYEFYHPILN
jgi:hypothetical protein